MLIETDKEIYTLRRHRRWRRHSSR